MTFAAIGAFLLISLTFCLQGHLVCFLLSADIFQNHCFRKKKIRNTIRVSNSLDFVGPDLGPNCL